MALTPEQIKLRDGKLTASAVAPLMTADRSKIMNMYYGMIGSTKFVPEDLSQVWPVQLGSATEEVNLRFYEYSSGHVLTRRGEVVTHAEFDWAACTLDGWDDDLGIPVECKHVNGRTPRKEVIERYQPQFHYIMEVTQTDEIALSLIEGANEPVIELIEKDDDYTEELMTRAKTFMLCVQTLSPPADMLPATPLVIPVRTVDMSDSNHWCVTAEQWLSTRRAAADNSMAARVLKALVPEDAKCCFGAGIEIARSKAGSLTIKERRD